MICTVPYASRTLARPSPLFASVARQSAHRRVCTMAQGRIVTDRDEALKIAGSAKVVAVLGIKTESQASQPAYFVPDYLQSVGCKIIPVPVYYPEVTEILGEPVVRDLKHIKQQVDILDVFRRPADLLQHLDDILAMDPRPACVWLQSGISHPEFEAQLASAGITVVPSRCLKVDRAAAGGRSAM